MKLLWISCIFIWFIVAPNRTTKIIPESYENGIEVFVERNPCNFDSWCNQYQWQTKCCISVSNVNGDLVKYLNDCMPEDCVMQELTYLKIHNTGLSEATLEKGWLSSFHLPIINLYLQNCILQELGQGVFSGVPFELMVTLYLIDLKQLTSIQQGTFSGTNLITFSISYIYPYSRLNFEANCFEGFDSVSSFQLIRCIKDSAMLHNISGRNAAILGSAQIFDLQENQIKTIEDYSFNRAPQIRALYLHNNLLSEIEQKAFWSMPKIQSIHIQYNHLTYLPPDVFKYKNPNEGKIYAQSNFWICNCDLKWFIEYAVKTGFVHEGPSLKCDDGKLFSEVDLSSCPPTISTTTKCEEGEGLSENCVSTTSPLSSHGTTPTKYLRSISCSDAKFDPPIVAPASIETISDITINLIGDEEIRITCIDLDYEDNDLANIEVELIGRLENLFLLLFVSNNNNDYVCYANLKEEITMKGLQRNENYTMCLIANNGDTSLPFHCLGFKLQPKWNERAWITNQYQGLALGMFCLILIIIIVLTSIIVFYVIRQNPNLLKGNKRVIIVDTKTTDAIVMPKDYEGIYRAPSYVSEELGYIKTKSAHSYAEVSYYKPPILRIRDEGDCNMANVTYASTSSEDGDRPRRVRRRSGSVPPPLPPPNRISTIDLNYDEITKIEEYSTA